MARGRSRDEIVKSFLHFKMIVDRQNDRHPGQENELVIATMLNPPRFVWCKDDGPPPKNHKDMLQDIMELNNWIIFFNKQNGKTVTPRFHRFGIRDSMTRTRDGKKVRVKKHIMTHWDVSEPVLQRMHLSEQVRHRLGLSVTRHFKGEFERNGKLG